ncbi:hypothetical protein AFL42_09085 [Oceanobacillus caeni]|uniref:Uncharacterized protein n=1 Tax=Oceanobacillus caeni TaxID=405946 RepID=A0ABR5MJ48_9BACI|nr:hypothetical protein AFL42_09085 [Oceanobacillus caeni]
MVTAIIFTGLSPLIKLGMIIKSRNVEVPFSIQSNSKVFAFIVACMEGAYRTFKGKGNARFSTRGD